MKSVNLAQHVNLLNSGNFLVFINELCILGNLYLDKNIRKQYILQYTASTDCNVVSPLSQS
jgi:hypothetical protein